LFIIKLGFFVSVCHLQDMKLMLTRDLHSNAPERNAHFIWISIT